MLKITRWAALAALVMAAAAFELPLAQAQGKDAPAAAVDGRWGRRQATARKVAARSRSCPASVGGEMGVTTREKQGPAKFHGAKGRTKSASWCATTGQMSSPPLERRL